MRAKLEFLSGERKGTAFELGGGDTRVGRRPELELVFSASEGQVSRQHATILFQDGQYVVRDDGSTNGTFVNDRKIQEQVLRGGDVVGFGLGGPSARFVVEEEVADTLVFQPPPSVGATAEIDSEATAEPQGGSPPPASTRRKQDTVEILFRELVIEREADKGTTEALRDFVGTVYGKSKRRTRVMVGSTLLIALIATGGVLWWSRQEQQRIRQEGRQQLAELQGASAGMAARLREVTEELTDEVARRESAEERIRDLSAAYRALREEQQAQFDELEDRLGISERVAERFSRGVALTTAVRRFREAGSARLVRYKLTADGAIARDTLEVETDEQGSTVRVRTRPVFALDGAGPPLEGPGSCTGFLIHSGGWMLTNRHCVDGVYAAEISGNRDHVTLSRLLGTVIEPVYSDFRAFFPSEDESYAMSVVRVSREADVALTRLADVSLGVEPLPLAPPDEGRSVGEDVVLVAYPKGSLLLLYRLGEHQKAAILGSACRTPACNSMEDQARLAQALASANAVWPLVGSGQITALGDHLTYSVVSSSAGGSSGGAVVGPNLQVVGVNSGIFNDERLDLLRAAPIRYAWQLFPPELRRFLAL